MTCVQTRRSSRQFPYMQWADKLLHVLGGTFFCLKQLPIIGSKFQVHRSTGHLNYICVIMEVRPRFFHTFTHTQTNQ